MEWGGCLNLDARFVGSEELNLSVPSFRLLRRRRTTPHRAANDRFVSRHRRLHQAASCVARFMRPSFAATGINGSDGRVALTRCVGRARSLRIISRRDQDLWQRTGPMLVYTGA